MKLSMPIAVLIGFAFVALAILFTVRESMFVASAKAEIAGMDSYDLRYDYDFKRAVQSIVEDCTVDGTDISYIYISC